MCNSSYLFWQITPTWGGNMGLYRDLIATIRGTKTIEQLERLGFKHGENLQVMFGVVIDWGH